MVTGCDKIMNEYESAMPDYIIRKDRIRSEGKGHPQKPIDERWKARLINFQSLVTENRCKIALVI